MATALSKDSVHNVLEEAKKICSNTASVTKIVDGCIDGCFTAQALEPKFTNYI
jgi:hypothetical protein